ncbi:MAG: TonB-dependent receptor, partial [Arenimonas sp.]
GVYLELAATGNVDIKFADATTLSAVQVTATRSADVFDSKKMGAGTSISREKLNSFASIQRNLQDYARLDPRISQTDKDRGEISAGGQNSRFNSITIDGVATNDPFGLEANNLPTLKQPISIDAIQSAQVNISNYDVTQKGYTGANINAITKSGTNDFKGSVYYVYRDDSFSGDKYNRTTDDFFAPEKFTEDTKGLTFGGPIIEDKLFFFVSYEELASSRATPTFGPLGGTQTNVAITPEEIAATQAIATTTYGIDIGGAAAPATDLTVKDSLIKLDANLGERHRASLRWSKTEQSEPLFPNNFNNLLSLSSHWYSQEKTIETYVGQWFADWTDSFSTEFKASYRDYASAPLNNSNLPSIRLNFAGALPVGSPAVSSTSAGLIFGTERSRHFNDLSTKTWNYYLGANLFMGDHEFKFGIDYDDNDVYNAFLQDTRGNYTFDCINAAPAAGGNPAFTYNNVLINSPTFSCASATRAQRDAAVLENFQRGRPLNYSVQVPINGFALNDGAANWSYQNIGLFLQDTWTVNDKLTVNLGLRFDQKQMNTSPVLNPLAARAAINGSLVGSTTPQNGTVIRDGGALLADLTRAGAFGRRNDNTLDGNTLFQPRVGFNYTFDTDRPTQLRGGFGLFEGNAANVWLSNVYSNTGITTGIISCSGTGSTACPRNDGFFEQDPAFQPGIAGSPPAPNVDFLSEDLEQPSVWKANLAFEHELPFFNGATFSVEYIHTEVQDAIYYKNLNLGAPIRTGVDGRDLFYHPVGYNTSCYGYSATGAISLTTSGAACGVPAGGSRTRAMSNPSFNSVLLAERTGKGGGDNLSLSLSGAFLKEWNWSIGYAYTAATEVSSLSSSVSNSSWQSVSVFNANEEVAANSAYLVKDRFTGALNWKHNFFGNYATRFGLFYEGRKGKPYSWIYNNDLNGDNVTNDLLYIPVQGSSNVCFRLPGSPVVAGAATCVNDTNSEARFWDLVDRNGLRGYEGGVVARNSSFAPWTNNFDVRLSQELPGFIGDNKFTITLDILNVGNLINKKWGQIDEVGFQSQGGLARSFVDYLGLDANGNYVYGVTGNVEDLTNRQLKGESSWAAQFTVKYEF